MAEREWAGGYLRMGTALIGVQDLRTRCVMTTYDPDTPVRDKEVLRDIYRRFDGKLALNGLAIERWRKNRGGGEVKLVRGRACTESSVAAGLAPGWGDASEALNSDYSRTIP